MPTMLVILDGLADEPLEALGGCTPLAAAHTPHLDRLAAGGRVGRVDPTPRGQAPGSESGIPFLLGIDAYPYGRATVEAAARGIVLQPGETVCRASVVRLSGPPDDPQSVLIEVLDGLEAYPFLAALAGDVALPWGVRLYPDTAGRHIITGCGLPVDHPAPHGMTGLPVALAGTLAGLNRRLPEGLAVWPWGGGAPFAPDGVSPFTTLITGVDLVRGIGAALGMNVPEVHGATGDVDTDLRAKARAALDAAEHGDDVVMHIEAPDMAAHRCNPPAKRAVIERVDQEVFGEVSGCLTPAAPRGHLRRGDLRLIVTCDHGTSSKNGRHLGGPVPYLVSEGRGNAVFTEAAAASVPVSGRDAWLRLIGEAVPC